MSTIQPDRKRASGVAVVCGKSVLLAKRIETWEGKPVELGGYWSIFAGSIEEGENPMTCAVRELKEESGIDAQIHEIKYIRTLSDDITELSIYVLEVNDLVTPELNEEHTEYGWFRISDLNLFTEKIDPKVVKCVKKYIHEEFD